MKMLWKSNSSIGSSRPVVQAALVVFYALSMFAATSLLAEVDNSGNGAAGSSRALRLSGVQGQVQVVQDGQVIANPAYDNLPLFEGAQVITGADGRAEVQTEDGSLARLSPNTTLTLTVLQRQSTGTRTEFVLNTGLAYFELQASTPENILRVNYGAASFESSGFSVVRLNQDVIPGALAVFSGNIHLDKGNSLQLDIHGGESLNFDPSNPDRYNLTESIDPDSWDTWNSDLDQALTAQDARKTAASGEFVNQSAGFSDLDSSGNWYNVPGQGYIWSPFEAISGGTGWDPYGFGNWVFYPRYGYVFVSGYSWGYAPFGCGMWNYYDSFGWGWAPGGGCNPWWGMGGWYPNIGSGPGGYRIPRRPVITNPIHPKPRPLGPGSHPILANIPVDRRPLEPQAPLHVARINQPVVIGGHVVQPLRPITPRQTYQGFEPSNGGRTVQSSRTLNGIPPANHGTLGNSPTRPGYTSLPPASNGNLGRTNSGWNPTRSTQSAPSVNRSAPSGGWGGSGGGGMRSSPPPASAPHSSGGGGGGSAPAPHK